MLYVGNVNLRSLLSFRLKLAGSEVKFKQQQCLLNMLRGGYTSDVTSVPNLNKFPEVKVQRTNCIFFF